MAGGEEDTRVLVVLLRTLRGWNQAQMAAAVGIGNSEICRYETGRVQPPPGKLERLAAAAGVPMRVVDQVLLPAIHLARMESAVGAQPPVRRSGRTATGSGETMTTRESLTEAVCQAADGAMKLFTSVLLAPDRAVAAPEMGDLSIDKGQGEPELDAAKGTKHRSVVRAPKPTKADDRYEIADLWMDLEACTALERRFMVDVMPEYQTWRFAEHLCDESLNAAARDAAFALELATLAVHIANLENHGILRHRLEGYCLGFLANALRVSGRLREAETEFARAWKSWLAGAEGDPEGLLAEWKLFSLEASLRRDLRQFEMAKQLLDQAGALAPPEAADRLALKAASILTEAGDLAGAVEALRLAAPTVEGGKNERLKWVLHFNLISNLCHLGRFEEAESRLPDLRRVTVATVTQESDLDSLRSTWLCARVALGRGRNEEAVAFLESLRAEFSRRRIAVEAALVSLELALLYLADGRTAEVRRLAAEMAWIFASEGIEREALAALHLFEHAARQERATADQVRSLLDLLGQARLLVCGRPF